MKHLTTTLITLSLVALLLGACMPAPAASPVVAPAATGPAAPAGGWQTYTDAEVGFSIQMPPTWSSEILPDQNGGAIHGTAFTGPEGGVEVYWGVGFGGACPQGTKPVLLAQGELPACHATSADGTEVWSQIGYEVNGGNSFSVRAYTSNAQPSSHDLVLQVLATLTFMPPAQPSPEGDLRQAGAAVANPASENCIQQGGTLSIEERGDGGQYGICTFEDNQQCEEWALFHGHCPAGGVKVTGYATPAARYCAISGGQYAITGNSGQDDEQGTCTFKNGSQCDAWTYYNGKCDQSAAAADPLPSWNTGPTKDTILKFVADVTDPAGPSYVTPADRIAVFDNDGTLWTEKPIPVQAAFVFARIAQMAPDHPEWQTTQPYQAVLEQDVETLQSLSPEDAEKLIFATHAGMTEEEFEAEAKAFLDAAKHPRFGVPYTETVFQPMLELLAFLRTNGFRTFIVSGGGVEFMRVFSEEVYGIPRENVVGSSLQYEFRQTPDGSVLVRQPELVTFDDREMKPVNIQLHIGRRPILAGGNSDGDLAMFQYAGGRSSSSEGTKVPFLNLLVVHDDAEREYDYLTGTDEVMAAAAQSPWMFVSMKNDFKTVFPTPAATANPATQYCLDQGGQHFSDVRGDGGEYGVCVFETGACDEWAMMRGDCPVGGVKTSGYASAAGLYCVMTGGEYTVTGNEGASDEQGTCTFKDGSHCDAWDYYNGKCDQSTATAAPATAATIQPLPVEVCNGQAQAMAHALDVVEVTQSEAPIIDPVTGASGTGCMATVTGTGEQFESPQAAVKTLGSMLEDQGWTRDPMLQADGPTGTDVGYRKGDQICWVGATWWPDDSANCPKDQPVSTCQVTPAQQNYTVTLNCGAEAAQGGTTTAGMPNPASVNCTEQGGTLSIEERADGGQYGVCYFEDNMQCEEWALLRGDCPVGGVKVTGYATPAARYCAITGGQYAITGNSGAADEQGTCTLVNGSQQETTLYVCDAWDYYNGKCDQSNAAAATVAPAATPAAKVPLVDAAATMDPQDVWENFYELTQIPRPSHHEEQVRDFLAQFGRDLGLETIVDDVGNVLIRKPASPGMESRHGVILQAHMDMVPQKTPDSTHDFLTDPIDAYVDGDWVVADRTTLGADDGIGVAIAMAILQSKTLSLGPIEALFTVNEEDGMDGALGLQPGLLQGTTLINIDWETEGTFAIGSAGGDYGDVEAGYVEVATPADTAAYTVTVSGLQGGHSGMDIDKGRGHATKLLVRLLRPAADQHGVRVAQLAGGTAANAIPTLATALVVVPNEQVDAFLEYVQQFEGIVRSELAAVEPDLKVEATPAAPPARVMDEKAQRTVIDALYGTPQGILRMSDAVPGLVETSTNMGIANAANGQLAVTCYPRSSVDTALDDVNQMIASVWDLAGSDVAFSGRFSGWNPNPNSPILLLMQDVYQELYGQEPGVVAIHAGLECGTIVSKYPGMDAISIGPTLQYVHTPNERLQVATVKKLNDFLLETLKRMPEK